MQRRPAAVRRLLAAIDACKPPHACYPPGTETELADLRPKRCPPETTSNRKIFGIDLRCYSRSWVYLRVH